MKRINKNILAALLLIPSIACAAGKSKVPPPGTPVAIFERADYVSMLFNFPCPLPIAGASLLMLSMSTHGPMESTGCWSITMDGRIQLINIWKPNKSIQGMKWVQPDVRIELKPIEMYIFGVLDDEGNFTPDKEQFPGYKDNKSGGKD